MFVFGGSLKDGEGDGGDVDVDVDVIIGRGEWL